MARGKQTCRILKEIRRQIAEANDIELITSECTFRGDCLGTCPKCEAEVRYLEQQLRARSLAGKAVALAGISAGLILMSGCSKTPSAESICPDVSLQGEPEIKTEQIDDSEQNNYAEEVTTGGEVEVIEHDSIYQELNGYSAVVIRDETLPSHIYDVEEVDVPPKFPGGHPALQQFIDKHMIYPEDAKAECIEDRVKVSFEVDTSGHVCNPLILTPGNHSLDHEAYRIMKLLPDFIPAKRDGKKVAVWMTMTIDFNLSKF